MKVANCKNCGNERPIYAKGKCQYCYWKAKRTPVKKRKKETGERDIFREIWTERSHISQISGKKLRGEDDPMWHWQFAHLLSKGAYPSLRHDKQNILLMTPEEHQEFDGGDREKFLQKNNAIWVLEKMNSLRKKYHQNNNYGTN